MDNPYTVVHRDPVHTSNFTILNNKVLRNSELSYQARFLLAWLLTWNPKEGFKFSTDKISKSTKIPLARTRILIKELQDAGYLKLTQLRDGQRFGYCRWDIYESPILDNTVDQQSVEPEIITQTEYNFNRIWDAYPADHRKDRKAALKAYKQIPEADNNIDKILLGLEEMKGNQNWLKDDGRWIPGLKKFLENRIWEEGLNNPTSLQGRCDKTLEVMRNADYGNFC